MSTLSLLFDEDWDDPRRPAPPPAPQGPTPGQIAGRQPHGVPARPPSRGSAGVPARPPSRGSGLVRPPSRSAPSGPSAPGRSYGQASCGQSRPAVAPVPLADAGYVNLGSHRQSVDMGLPGGAAGYPPASMGGRRSASPSRSRGAPQPAYGRPPGSSPGGGQYAPAAVGPRPSLASSTSSRPSSYAPLARGPSGGNSPTTASSTATPMPLSPTAPVAPVVNSVRQLVLDKPLHQILSHVRQITISWTPSQTGELIARLTPSWSPEQTAYLFMGMIPGLRSPTPRTSTRPPSAGNKLRDDFCAGFSRATPPMRLVHVLAKVPDDVPLPSPTPESSPNASPSLARRSSFGAGGSAPNSRRSSLDLGRGGAVAAANGATRKQVLGNQERMSMLQISETYSGQSSAPMASTSGYAPSYH